MKRRNKINTEKKNDEKIWNWVGTLLMWPFKLFPIKKNRIYFQARYGQKFNCNPRAFFEYLYQTHHDEFEFVWCLNKPPEELPKDVKTAKHMSIKDQYYLHTSKYVISNMRFPMLFAKRKRQVQIHTTHSGSVAYKMVEKDQNLSIMNLWNSKVDSTQMDALLAGSKQAQKVKGECFFCEGKTYLTGLPRMDQLVNQDQSQIQKTREKLKVDKDDFLVLYAPTFRENQPFEDLLLDNQILKEAFEKSTKKNVKILYRFHPYLLKKKAKEMQFEEYVLNVTEYPEIQDLILVSTVMITDFSSCMFDMMIAGKPTIIYKNDGERYLANERGVYIPPDQLPFPTANNEKELHGIAENFNKTIRSYKERYAKFCEDMGCIEDGHSCERVYALMKKLAEEKENK